MPTAIKKSQIQFSRNLRNDATEGEQRLWSELRQFRKLYGFHVRRQVPIGPYIADFAVHSNKLVIELDGEFHFTKQGQAKDKVRDEWFRARGYRTIRINTAELSENLNGCIETLLSILELRS